MVVHEAGMELLIYGVFSGVMLKKNSMFQRFIVNLLDSCSKKGFFYVFCTIIYTVLCYTDIA